MRDCTDQVDLAGVSECVCGRGLDCLSQVGRTSLKVGASLPGLGAWAVLEWRELAGQ